MKFINITLSLTTLLVVILFTSCDESDFYNPTEIENPTDHHFFLTGSVDGHPVNFLHQIEDSSTDCSCSTKINLPSNRGISSEICDRRYGSRFETFDINNDLIGSIRFLMSYSHTENPDDSFENSIRPGTYEWKTYLSSHCTSEDDGHIVLMETLTWDSESYAYFDGAQGFFEIDKIEKIDTEHLQIENAYKDKLYKIQGSFQVEVKNTRTDETTTFEAESFSMMLFDE